ncbi:hypothetical protein [Peijinzhouia sedimentorum]
MSQKKGIHYNMIEKVVFHGSNDLHQLLQSANQFRRSFKIIDELVEVGYSKAFDGEHGFRDDIYESRYLNLAIPSIVILSFSCELQLKAIIRLELNKISTGHSLLNLYKELSDKSRTSIYSSVNAVMKDKSGYDFLEYLKNCSSVFIEWRYFHEDYRELNFKFLKAFGEAINSRLIDIQSLS